MRSKGNFDVLEGFRSELLKEDVQILEILESESNKESMLDKQNRVDLKARLSGREIVLIEIQYERQYDHWFDLGQGSDYVYLGTTQFRGLHQQDVLHMSSAERAEFEAYFQEMRCRNSESKSNYLAGKVARAYRPSGFAFAHSRHASRAARFSARMVEGHQEGLEQGLQRQALETARKLRAKGFSKLEIMEITGLDPRILDQMEP